MVEGQPLREGPVAFQEAWGQRPDPPAITVHVVKGPANPGFLVEIDATAAI